MIDKSKIIIDYFHNGKSQRIISREMRISRPTVKKYIEAYKQESLGTAPRKRSISAPQYGSGTSSRSKRRLVSEVTTLIDELLAANEKKVATGKHKQQMKGTDIHEYLLEKGHQVGYTTVCNYIKQVKRQTRPIYIRQSYAPGQSIEFDWCEARLQLAGEQKRVMMAVFTCCYSNYRQAYLFHRQDMQSFLQAHVQFFEDFGRVPQEVVYDNMRVAVGKFSYDPKEKEATDSLLKLSSYYLFNYRFCNAYKGNEKGSVERSVEYVRRKAFCKEDSFDDLSAANTHLSAVCHRLNQQTSQGKTESIAVLAQEEKEVMRPSKAAYDIGELLYLKLDKYHCFCYGTNYYSVPESLQVKQVAVKVYPDKLLVYAHQGHRIVAEHQRGNGKYQWYIQLGHYLKTLAQKPGAIARSTALQQADSWLQDLFETHFQGREKAFIALLQWQQTKAIPITDLRRAIEKCLRISPYIPLEIDKVKLLLQTSATAEKEEQTTSTSGYTASIQQHCRQQLSEHQALFKTATT
ncbi:MAG: IS21 family transposase [Ekhidna sp.]|nr:IS21 family transposase [Ekhidna sp.]